MLISKCQSLVSSASPSRNSSERILRCYAFCKREKPFWERCYAPVPSLWRRIKVWSAIYHRKNTCKVTSIPLRHPEKSLYFSRNRRWLCVLMLCPRSLMSEFAPSLPMSEFTGNFFKLCGSLIHCRGLP